MSVELQLSKTVLGCPEPRATARFYAALLGWEPLVERDDWVVIGPSGANRPVRLAFQTEPAYEAPAWPDGAGPVLQAHLDLRVEGALADGVARALRLGAVEAAHQPQDDVRVMLDPDRRPFCLFSAPRPG